MEETKTPITMISHGKFISFYDFINKEWIKHSKFTNEIYDIF